VTVTIVIRPTQIGTLNNSAMVTAAETDPNTSNNSATATTGVVPNLPGSYSGSSTSGNTLTETNCIDTTLNGVFQFNSSITISSQTGGSFTGVTGTLTGVGSAQGTTVNLTNGAGTIGSSGAITGGTFNYSTVRGGMTVDSGTGTFTGTATASPAVSQLVFNFSSQSTSGTGCRATGTVTGTPAAGGGGGGGGCFIATAAFGSPMAAEVKILREFRDRTLLTSEPGRLLVAAYYQVSPPLARLIAAHDGLRAATRATLRPVVWWARLALDSPGLAWSLLILGVGGLVIGMITPFTPFRARGART
jgi:hypothetical protein